MAVKKRKPPATKPELFQIVTLTFNDGRKAQFYGPAVVNPKEDGRLGVTAVVFTVPAPLPAGFKFIDFPLPKKEG